MVDLFYHPTYLPERSLLMDLRIGDYIENPSGEGRSAMTGLAMVRDDFIERYRNLSDDIEYKTYNYEDGYLFHLLIPSEQDKFELKYDVVLYIFPYEDSSNRHIKDWGYQVFCNSPSFVYTFAYVYNKINMLFQPLVNKYDKKVLSNEPTMRNPKLILNYEKTIFYAIYHIANHFTRSNLGYVKGGAVRLDDRVFKSIRTDKKILEEIDAEKSRIKRNEKKKVNLIDQPKKILNDAKKAVKKMMKSTIQDKSSIKRIDGSNRKTSVRKIKKK